MRDWLEHPSRTLPSHLTPDDWPQILRADPQCFKLLPGSLMNDGTRSQGFCFSSPKLLENIRNAHEELGDRLCLKTDGTYKLHHGNWVLCPLGTHVTYRGFSRKEGAQGPVHKFVPFLYMLTKTESSASYARLFAALKAIASSAFGIELKVSYIKRVLCISWCVITSVVMI